ncbi:DUF6603 domain-containing protein [Methylococcus sp. EFPC2]|uniref:DUF6603 domain-containing protein n=1 Tax=Methylococcus sp. EFPC2 TaxID=2812648 RepID=UPI0019682CD2|nr:DUF6603 domain-containing protein [Methylococcus sp. EFPC2]QSA98825.1 hypothetical protein JWZ97_08625 [Methylococcus sp. EFPC2]
MSFEQRLLAGVASALTAVGSIVKMADGPKFILAKLGWELPPSVSDIGLAGLDMARLSDGLARWTTLEADTASSDEDRAAALGDLALAAVALLAELTKLHLQAPQEYLDRSGIRDEFLTRLLDLYLIQSLAVAARPAFDIAVALGWFELRRYPADPERFQIEHIRHIVHWDRIPLLLSDPAKLLRDTYGWGTARYDANTLVVRLGGVLQHIAADVRRRELPALPLSRLHGGTPPAHPPQLQLLCPILSASTRVNAEAGLSVFGLPPTTPGGSDGGLGFAPYADGGTTVRIPLSSTLSLGITADADLGSGLALVLRPGVSPALRTGLNQTIAGTAPTGAGVQIDLTLSPPNGETTVNLFDTSTARAAAASLALALEVRVEGAGTDAELSLRLCDCELALSSGDWPPLLDNLAGNGSLVAKADVSLSWSHRHGVRLNGRAGLKFEQAIGRVLGPLSLDVLSIGLNCGDASVEFAGAISLTARLGPVSLSFDQVGVRAGIVPGPGNLGSANLAIRPVSPTAIGVAVNAPTVTGGGFLRFDPAKQEYAGMLQLEIAEALSVKAVGLLTTRMPDGSSGYSLVILIASEGFAPIQLGFGFTLTGLGGLLGIHRTVAVDVLRGGLKSGTLGSLLFPPDPIRNAPQIVSDLRAVFPPVRNRHVFGPMAQIEWGTPTLLTLQLALILEMPEPVRLVVLGRLMADLPSADHALVRLRMDAVGLIDFNREEIALDATLYDSRLLEFALTGDMALRACWGANPDFILAVGGFNPRYPVPAGFPRLQRLALSLGDGDNPKLRFESYLALTSNTVQFGGRLDFAYSASGFTLAGFLGMDALFQFDPFAFVAEIAAQVALKRGRSTLMAVGLNLSLAGPTPWHVWGKATFKILFFKVKIGFDHRFGHDRPAPLPAPVDALALLAAALGDRRNWSATLPRGEPAVVTLRESAALRLHPLAELSVRQRVLPLNRTLTRFGNAPLAGGATAFTVTAAGALQAGYLQEAFAPAQFQDLSDDDKLARPAFEPGDAGLRFGTEGLAYRYDEVAEGTIRYETLIVDPSRPTERQVEPYTPTATALAAAADYAAAAQAPIRRNPANRYRVLERAV